MKIKFTQDRSEKAKDGRTFKKDEVYEVNDASGAHWINRGVAVQVPDSTRVTKAYEVPNELQLKANAEATAAHDDDAKKLVK